MNIIDVILAAGPLSENILHISATANETVFVQTQNTGFLLFLSGRRIVFEAVLDVQITGHRARILASLLTYNSVWQETGMIRMALTSNAADGQPMLIADMIIDETFTGENVALLIDDLNEKALIWCDIIASGADDGADLVMSETSLRV